MLTNRFFEDKTLKVAPCLLGKYLVRKKGKQIIRKKITEVEAYVGEHDLACHASKGRTSRTEVMYGPAGTIYVYLIYGMYWMLNIVTEEKDYPSAILIRSTENFKGPGVLTRELKINKTLNGKTLGFKSGLWIEDGYPSTVSKSQPKQKIMRSPRVGVSYAGKNWADKPYRFNLKN
jgi:DNA-3-methyladenine glycosylase